MGHPLSCDLRDRALAAVDAGLSRRGAAARFGVSAASVIRWDQLRRLQGHALAKAEFATLRIRLLKIGARIRETAHRVRIAFAAACPDAALVRDIAITLRPAPA